MAARNRKLQRLARERMKQTGEKYTTALRAIEAETDSKPLGPSDFSPPPKERVSDIAARRFGGEL